jgi:hypothetical protein
MFVENDIKKRSHPKGSFSQHYEKFYDYEKSKTANLSV